MIIDVECCQTTVDLMVRLSNQAHDHHGVEFQVLVNETIVRFGVFGMENGRDGTGQNTFHGRALEFEERISPKLNIVKNKITHLSTTSLILVCTFSLLETATSTALF